MPAQSSGKLPETERIADFRRRTEAKLEGVRCPVHGGPPRLSFRGTTLREITISLSGCCDCLSALANKAIAEKTSLSLKP